MTSNGKCLDRLQCMSKLKYALLVCGLWVSAKNTPQYYILYVVYWRDWLGVPDTLGAAMPSLRAAEVNCVVQPTAPASAKKAVCAKASHPGSRRIGSLPSI